MPSLQQLKFMISFLLKEMMIIYVTNIFKESTEKYLIMQGYLVTWIIWNILLLCTKTSNKDVGGWGAESTDHKN